MRRMLSASGPSARARATAASRMRSRERRSRVACSTMMCTLYSTAYTDGGGRVLMGRSSIRSLAWFALAAQALFVIAWVVAGALQPGYSHAESAVSALAAKGAAHPWIVMVALTLLGLSALAL